MSPARISSTGTSSTSPARRRCAIARRASSELRQLTPRPTGRALLERVSAGEHHGDDGAGQVLAERERAGHRDAARSRRRRRRPAGGRATDQVSGTSIAPVDAAQTHVRRTGVPDHVEDAADQDADEGGEREKPPVDRDLRCRADGVDPVTSHHRPNAYVAARRFAGNP